MWWSEWSFVGEKIRMPASPERKRIEGCALMGKVSAHCKGSLFYNRHDVETARPCTESLSACHTLHIPCLPALLAISGSTYIYLPLFSYPFLHICTIPFHRSPSPSSLHIQPISFSLLVTTSTAATAPLPQQSIHLQHHQQTVMGTTANLRNTR